MKKLQMNNCKLKLRLSSVISSISGADAKLKRHTLRVAAFLVSVLLITGSFFDSSLTAFSASDDEEAYCDLTLEVYPEGEGSDKAVYLNGMMPKDASATAVDVSSDFKKRDGSTNISEDNPDASLVAAYDITITSGKNEYQPDEDKPVRVEITDPKLSEESSYELWHIHDNGEKESVDRFTVEDGKISFTATGFSVYAIVEVAGPFSSEEVKSINDLVGNRATAGFCLFYGNRKFFTSNLNANGALIETNSLSSAAVWFFNKTGDYYTISTMINGQEKFIHTSSGNEIELSDSADLFLVTPTENNSFYLKKSNENKWLQHSGSGNGIRYYQKNTNSTNSRIKMIFADSMEIWNRTIPRYRGGWLKSSRKPGKY